MRAVAVVSSVPGSPELVELKDPEPESGEVLVRVSASSINGFDLSTSRGELRGMMEHRFPLVLGKDFAGRVEAVGADVDGYEIGNEVFGVVTKPFLGTGSLADYVTVPAAVGLARLPDDVSLVQAGALGLAGSAAVATVDAVSAARGGRPDSVDPLADATVLVSGATGGVGSFVVQLAAARGARVLATGAPGADTEFLRSFSGSDFSVIDYTADIREQVLARSPDGVDVVVHLAGELTTLTALARDGGVVASTLAAPEAPKDRNITTTMVTSDPTSTTLTGLARLVATNQLIVPVGATYDLADAPAAFTAFGAGARGKIVVITG